MEFLGYPAIFLMGVTLGMIGAGGSILTVPILVYLFRIDATLATAYSLVLVGATAATGAIRYTLKGHFDREAFLTFGLSSVVGVYLARRYLLPAMPETFGSGGEWEFTRDALLMVVFSGVMLSAAVVMIRGKAKEEGEKVEDSKPRPPLLVRRIAGVGEGLVVGGITGMVGAGGGFLIVPALVCLLKVSLKRAVATSLLIIAAKSLLGFVGDLQASREVDWPFVLSLLLLSSLGILVGGKLGGKIPQHRLQRGFGYFVLVAGLLVLGAELFR